MIFIDRRIIYTTVQFYLFFFTVRHLTGMFTLQKKKPLLAMFAVTFFLLLPTSHEGTNKRMCY